MRVLHRQRVLSLLSLSIALACRADDSTITRGADGKRDWARRLAAAVPLGMAADSARTLLESNGFRCQEGTDSVPSFWCEKQGGGKWDIVTRKWTAVVTLDANRRIVGVRTNTWLTGP